MEYIINCEDKIKNAVDRAKAGDVLKLAPGVYREKLVITKPGLTLDGGGKAVISWQDAAYDFRKDGGTFKSYTVLVAAPGVRFKNLTVENTAGNPREKGQSVALSVMADDFKASGCRFCSTQDTLFLGPLPDDLTVRYKGFLSEKERYLEGSARQQFTNCYIEGSVDFIFGCGEAQFTGCEIHSVYDGRDVGYVAAPSHSLKQSRGFLFQNCRFTGDERLTGKVFLARPWRDFGKAVFLDCDLEAHISRDGFDSWNESGREKTARFYYGGVNNSREFVFWARRLSSKEAENLRYPEGGAAGCL